jgi:hypothetical protein
MAFDGSVEMKMHLFGFGEILQNFTEKIVQTFVSKKIYWKTKENFRFNPVFLL